MAAFLFVFQAGRQLKRERVFRDRSQALDSMSDSELIQRYRFPRQEILQLTDVVSEDVQRGTSRCHALPTHIQVMVTLRFLAKGEYLSEVADVHGISVSSASRVIDDVCISICRRVQNIALPATDAELRGIREDFHEIARFPNVVGAIDGTLIAIQGPGGMDEHAYVCRKGYHAINVQAVADARLRFMNIVVKWPGSTHDAFMLANSSLPRVMETQDGWLLGDSGYPLKTWLMTPIMNPVTAQEQRFNLAHCRTRNVVERAFGVLKARFRCLHKTGGSLQFKPGKCVKIIEAAFRLHNKAISDNIPLMDGGEIINLHRDDVVINNGNRSARDTRQRLVQRF